MSKIRCNMCNWIGDEDNLSLVHVAEVNGTEVAIASESRENGIISRLRTDIEGDEFIDACPNCNTDSYLMDI